MSEFNWYYVMAAKGLQDFILRGDKLRLMVGGSELIEDLPNGFLADVLKAHGWVEDQDYTVLSRAAGGARLLFRDEAAARRLALVMPMLVSQYAPGLEVVQDVRQVAGGLAATMNAAEAQLQVRRNLPAPAYPVAGPLVARAPRSGLPVAGTYHHGQDKEDADAAMLAKAAAAEEARKKASGLLLKTLGRKPKLDPPDDLAALAEDDHSYIAILHADANGLGNTVATLLREIAGRPDAAAIYAKFSAAIAKATELAVQAALQPVEAAAESDAQKDPEGRHCLPFRPLVCAGDDVTLILRAADALGVAERLLESFERFSREELAGVGAASLQGQHLTACAGLVFLHKAFPFAQGYDLCESLCKYAKERTDRKASALAFWRLTATVADDFETVLRQELTSKGGILTMMPYRAGAPTTGPTVPQLRSLAQAVKAMPRGSLRGLLTRVYEGREVVDAEFARLIQVNGERTQAREGKSPAARLKDLQAALKSLTGQDGKDGLWAKAAAGAFTTPLHDAMELLAATHNQVE